MSPRPLLPCLQPPAWSGSERALARPLLAEPSPYVPWVALGYDEPGAFRFLERDAAPTERAPDALEAEAVAHLQQRPARWQDLELDLGGFKRLRMLVAGDDLLAAERILDQPFLLEAQRRLDAAGLLVGIPRRGFLVATALDNHVERVHTFGAVAATQFQGGESDPLTPALFTVRGGRVAGVVDVVARAVVPPARMEAALADAQRSAEAHAAAAEDGER
jgi:hypothetical protein